MDVKCTNAKNASEIWTKLFFPILNLAPIARAGQHQKSDVKVNKKTRENPKSYQFVT